MVQHVSNCRSRKVTMVTISHIVTMVTISHVVTMVTISHAVTMVTTDHMLIMNPDSDNDKNRNCRNIDPLIAQWHNEVCQKTS